MRLVLTPTHLEVRLAPFEKLGALRGDLHIPRERIVSADVVPEPTRTIHGFKVGLRIPGWRFVCWTGVFRHFWAIRSDAPAVHLTLRDGRMREATVCDPDAARIAAELPAPHP
jgi:hypothetical protein